jgi:nitrite reductase/ring-hydroxylating ferredoxin subunit
MQEEWVAVLKSNDIAAGDLVPVEVDGLALLVAADLDGKIFAIANSCPHLGTPLENGRSVYFLLFLFFRPLLIIMNPRNNCFLDH